MMMMIIIIIIHIIPEVRSYPKNTDSISINVIQYSYCCYF